MKWMVMVTMKARSQYDDPVNGEYDGELYDTMSEALVVKEIAKRHDDVEYAYIKGVDL